MSRAVAIALLICAAPALASAATPGWDPVWSDEFEGATLDTAKWFAETTNTPANNEQQAYIPQQVTVADGNMVITSENIQTNGKPYRSGRVHSNFAKRYGKWEVRADLPTSKGMWPAIWLLPNVDQYNWPSQGEIDIMENRGSQPNLTSSAYHYGASWQSHQFRFSEQTTARFGQPVNFHDGFHSYGVEWDQTKLRFFVDEVHYWTLFNSDTSGFLGSATAPMQTMLNTAVGGDFLGGAQPDGTTVWPQKFLIDYVRISDRSDDPLRFANGGFERNAGSLAGWSVFGSRLNRNNVSVHNEAVEDGVASLKIFGQGISGTNYSGVSQGISVSAGNQVQLSAESFVRSQDALGAGNSVTMKIEFYNDFGGLHGSSTFLNEVALTIANPSTQKDIWRQHSLSAVAPAGAVEARVAFVFTQASLGAGAVHIDNVSFKNLALPNVADANGDGMVDGADMLRWQQKLGSPDPSGPADGDFNFDGAVNTTDLDVWKEQSGGAAAGADQGAAVQAPEPGGASLALTGLVALVRLSTGRAPRTLAPVSLG